MKNYSIGLCFIGIVIALNSAAQESETTPDIWRALSSVERNIPTPAPTHPGNVFLVGEEVIAQASPEISTQAVRWQLLDDRGSVVLKGDLTEEQKQNSSIALGALTLGWYRLEFLDESGVCTGWTTTAVLMKLAAPIPQDSPICVDGANAWFAQDNPTKQEQLSQLAALAGVNWIRDRIRMHDILTGPDQIQENTTYEPSANLAKQYGLKVLQVFHDTPEWIVDDPSKRGRFPEDLRFMYRFGRAMGKRFQGRVQAWEPWNEANAPNFGGHTADEMCSAQKAAYLGFKASDPTIVVGWNAYAGVPTPLHTKIVLENETWPYYDTYNIHTYDWPHSYMALRQPVIEAACGRPIWITEADRGIPYETGEPWYDLSRDYEQKKGAFIAQSYAASLYAGAHRHFHFILGQYVEPNIQFGLLRLDMTPRLSYAALAAVGRFLAGAKCLGRVPFEGKPDVHIYAFRAFPDGVERDVLVAWAEKPVDWPDDRKTIIAWPFAPDLPIQKIYDYLGRPLEDKTPQHLRSNPIFVLMPPNASDKIALTPPPVRDYRPGQPVPLVMQLLLPQSQTVSVTETPWSVEQEHQVVPDQEIDLPLYIYNFSEHPLHGTVSIEHLPEGWTLTPGQWEITLESMQRLPLPAKFKMPKREMDKTADCWIKLRGDFGEAGKPVLAFRLISAPGEGYLN